MKRYVIFLCVLGLSFGINGCRPKPVVYHPVREGLRDAFLFENGTYWIYYDTIVGSTDSVIVDGGEERIEKEDEDEGVDEYQVIGRNVSVYRLAGPAKPVRRYGYSLRDNELDGIRYPFDQNATEAFEHIPSQVIHGQQYQSLSKIKAGQDTITFKEHIGIVIFRRDAGNDTTTNYNYQLVRSHIIQ